MASPGLLRVCIFVAVLQIDMESRSYIIIVRTNVKDMGGGSMNKRLIAVILSICMFFSMLPMTAAAEEAGAIASGSCGRQVNWTLASDGTLTISGSGAMDNYKMEAYPPSDNIEAPWYGNRKTITRIVVEDGVTSLGRCAFWDCTNANEVLLSDSVTDLGYKSFKGCTRLTSMRIPANVKYIGICVFGNCRYLREVIIPDGVKEIGSSAFYGCSSLRELAIPLSVTEIGSSAFRDCSSLREMVIPDGVTKIQSSLFQGCSNLQYVVIPSAVTKIESYAFQGCSIQEMVIPEKVTEIGNNAFASCKSLQNVVLPKGLTDIASCAFRDCIALTQLIVPSSVVTIGEAVFSGDKNLTLVGAKGSAMETYAKENGNNFLEHAHEWDDGDTSNLNCANNKVFSTCTVCGAAEEREITLPHREIVLANEFGNICSGIEGKAYHKCVLCGRYFLDKSGDVEITLEDIMERAEHSLAKVEEIQATCGTAGSIEHYKCEKCGKLFRDADEAEEIRAEDIVIEKLAHSLVKKEGVQATCTMEGRIAYYTCEKCGKLFRDADAAQEITIEHTNIEKLGHIIVKVEAKPASCIESGSIEHYKCERCGKLYRDMDGMEEITPEEIYTEKSGHSLVKVAAKLPTCGEEGHLAYYTCESCGKLYRDAERLEEFAAEDIVIKPRGHSLWRVEAKKATCTQKGNIEYFYCEECGNKFSDMSGSKQITKVEVNPLGHKYYQQTVKATLDKDGGTANVCQNCGHKIPINTYYSISTLRLSQDTYRYNGKVQTPKVLVKDSKGRTIPAFHYTVSYTNKKSKNIGKYKVTVRFKGSVYAGMKTLNYMILPPNIALKSVSASAEGQLKVRWGTKKNIDGYQVRYSSKSSMKGSKTKKVKGAKTKLVTLKKLAKGKKYYVQVRSYKKVSGKTYYGAWSKKKSARTLNIRLNYKSLSLETGQAKTLKLLGAKSPVGWKSSNPAVASVNSAGKVTAVADGAATVTAECQGRAYSCTVTVTTVTNFDRLYSYINAMGTEGSYGSRYITYSFYVDNQLWQTGIFYDPDTNQFYFICTGPGRAAISMIMGRNGSATAECNFSYDGSYDMFCEAATSIDVSSFTNYTKLNFTFEEYSGATTEMYNELANAELRVGMAAWNVLLKRKLGFGMSGLGFTSYY